MRSVLTADCKAGEILAEDIISDYGAKLVTKNTVLNEYIICRLNELGIKQIKVYCKINQQDDRDVSTRYHDIRKSYRESIFVIKEMVEELAAGKPLNAEKIINISNLICDGMQDSCEVIKVLHEQRGLDEYTYTHSLNVAFYSMLAGKWLGLKDEDIRTLVKAGLLHDIGKTRIPPEIINKKSRLSKEEFSIIKMHTRYGYDLVKETKQFSSEVCTAVLLHHERMDMSGYPFGIGGERISFYAKVIAVADVYDAMTSDRVYKERVSPFEVFEMFKTVGVTSFDPQIVDVFLTNLSAYYMGAKVLLNTGEVGEVVYVPPQNITDPIICINQDYIDLAKDKDRKIISMIS